MYEKTLKLGEASEEPNDSVEAEKTTNPGDKDWERCQSYFQNRFCSGLGMTFSVISCKMNTLIFNYLL